ncbi:cholinesterase 1-like [Ixodes scapularis]
MVLQIVPSVLKTLVLLANVIMVCASGAEPPVVNTPSGRLAGVRLSFENKFTDAFLGIPYAVPPLGDLRFRKPLPFPSWGNVRSASQYAPACSQLNFRIHYGVVLNNSLSSEDCLYLNIWKPSCARVDKCNSMLPVVVYVYGGAFQWGDTSMFYNDGLVFSSVNDVVFVSFNYRTGVFGFLTTGTKEAPGNLAFWDQLLALKWVQKHITAFGGDPGSVTLYGQSSGSMAVGVHVLSPLSRGLFKRCIFESGSLFIQHMLDINEEFGRLVTEYYDTVVSVFLGRALNVPSSVARIVHGDDLPYMLGSVAMLRENLKEDRWRYIPAWFREMSIPQAELAFSRQTVRALGNFAKTG